MAARDAKPPVVCPKCKSGRTSAIGIATTNPPLQLLRCGACGHMFPGGGSSAAGT